MPLVPTVRRLAAIAVPLAFATGLLSATTLSAQARPSAPEDRGFRFTVAAGPSASYRASTPHTVAGENGQRLAGSGGNGRHLALGVARPVGRALVLRVEGSYNRLTSPPNSWVPLDASSVARAALVDETAALGVALQVRLREDRTRWAPYLVAGGGIAANRLGTNADEGSARVTERSHHLRGAMSYGAGIDLPLGRTGRVTGAFAEVRMQRLAGDRQGSDFVPLTLGLRF